ncbi:hypothetical protein F5880DRAFT_1547403 [Lentinula raphanica]|nr:hypothetical protein F5880DRAFT_1547403 [Lentinula raphanica]
MLSSTQSELYSGVGQNPPTTHTLYVGNLTISPPPTGSTNPPDILEESLRELFRTRDGYQKLTFRQKVAGSMCSVEFTDVEAATKALEELDGNTLNGLVNGGIRLSYN